MRNKNQSNLLQKSWKNGIKEKEWAKEIYSDGRYKSLGLFVSVYSQVREVIKTSPKNILEIGIGGGATSVFLKNLGYNLTTCDFNKNLNPDFVADIKKLPFRNNSFDTVLACEILEHIPFEDFPKALAELRRVASRRVIISVPYKSTFFEFVFRFPGIRTLFKKPFLGFILRWPMKFGGIETSGQHYWEIDSSKYSLRKVRKILSDNFRIIRELSPTLNPYHYFFVLEK